MVTGFFQQDIPARKKYGIKYTFWPSVSHTINSGKLLSPIGNSEDTWGGTTVWFWLKKDEGDHQNLYFYHHKKFLYGKTVCLAIGK